KDHGAEDQEYAILTNIVHRGTFDISVSQHKKIKSIVKGELRESMIETELILLTLGEHTSTLFAKQNSMKNIVTARAACEKGGKIAGDARRQIESELGQKIVTPNHPEHQ